jgi:hypothetical protein
MTTRLVRTMRREIVIDDEPVTVIVSPDGVRLSKKRFRSGVNLTWKALWEGNREPETVEANSE